MSKSPLAGQVDISTKLDKSGGIYTGVREAQDLANAVTGAGQTITLDYADGQTQLISIATNDNFAVALANWPTTESGSMTIIVALGLGITVGTVDWSACGFINTPPDLTGVTASTGYGVYEIYFGAGSTFIFTVEEA